MSEVICIDAKAGHGKGRRPTGLKYMHRYTIIGEDVHNHVCAYCGKECTKVVVTECDGTWCQKRFVQAPPDEKVKAKVKRDVDADLCV
jgi:hypothetical protein